MNEVTQIHLGRTAFTISVDAQKELRDYLAAIKAQVGKGSADVLEEVELRMAELLSERGIAGEKVVLPQDVAFLKSQLGEPKDFESDGDKADEPEAADTSRHLFRDTDNAMVAGVAAGLARYFGIDAVIVRIIFVALAFAGASGILIYILLWLLVPEAKTTSDRLSMRGKAATVENLKQIVERADVPGAARRGSGSVARVLNVIGKVLLFIVGLPLVLAGSLGIIGTLAASVHVLVSGMRVGGHVVGPIGSGEVVGFIAAVITVISILLLLLLIGVAMMRRRWQLPAWGVATLVGVFFVAASVGGSMAADAIPAIQHRVESLHHAKTVQVGPFTRAVVTGDNLNVSFVPDSKTYVRYSYYGTLPLSQLHTDVTDGTLHVTAGNVANGDCNAFCTDIEPGLTAEIHAPKLTSMTLNGEQFAVSGRPTIPPVPVFFGWHPHELRRSTILYDSSSLN